MVGVLIGARTAESLPSSSLSSSSLSLSAAADAMGKSSGRNAAVSGSVRSHVSFQQQQQRRRLRPEESARSGSDSDTDRGDDYIIDDIIATVEQAAPRPAHLFSWEDVSAAETTAALASVALFWCNGMGALHHVLNKNVNKMDKLEKIVKKLGAKTK